MTSSSESSGASDEPKVSAPSGKQVKKPKVRTHTPRPDELSPETFEFIAAVDEYKRRHMRSFLDDDEVLEILLELGYLRAGFANAVTDEQLEDFAEARRKYRVDEGRLFPTWSELFELLTTLGYARVHEDPAA